MLLPINFVKNAGSSASKKLATGDEEGGGVMSMMINLKAKLMGIKELVKFS
jgi:hypothetical protein